MAISYDPLWKTLIDRKIRNRTDLCNMAGVSRSTIAKLGKNEYVALAVLEKFCLVLECRIEDVVEVLPDTKTEPLA